MQYIKSLLSTFTKKTISLSDLEKLIKPWVQSYDEFSQTILQLENEHILEMIKSKGRTTRAPFLAFHYRINKSLLVEDFHKELQRYRNILHPSITIDEYYRKDPSIWKNDLPMIKKIDHYLKRYSFPNEPVPAPERSVELVGDEKWITDGGGKELLERIGVFNTLQIIPVAEPLMFAVNPTKVSETTQLHLIVENKTTYQGLLPVLKETSFSTLVFGSGKKVISSIEQFSMQYPVEAHHCFYYFGDIDREGISIWHSLTTKIPAIPALPFYRACLAKEPAVGKEYQKERAKSVEAFLRFFTAEEQSQLKALFANDQYYPQEIIKKRELQQIWRKSNWKTT
ncbi:Wadjet anti-phage system protein JetD domain-containing protein [Bacillus smithii]|uniref:Wadjet anti-phage system protein JetD domain-containing protein n=1 Tax=Bacillus smithii TaxID=1479 RepID=UPI0022E0F23B|nr:Wadjet anti-phage system protein JetD domain-containing protein [Bacillus smithii]